MSFFTIPCTIIDEKLYLCLQNYKIISTYETR